jgi:hypothetical protein
MSSGPKATLCPFNPEFLLPTTEPGREQEVNVFWGEWNLTEP